MSTTEVLLLLLAAAVLAVPFGQAVWAPLNHLRYVLYQRRTTKPSAPLGFVGSLVYYWRSLVANAVMAWWALRALGRNGLRQPNGNASGPPVLCIHGFLRNGSCMWGVRRALEASGRPTRAVSMGLPMRRIERYAKPVARALRELTEAFSDQPIDIVAHSMGGIVLRQVLASHPDLASSVRRIVTLGSPHHGTEAVRGARGFPESRQMDRQGEFLANLPDFATSAPDAQVTTIAAHHDFIVYPESTSHLAGAEAIDIPDTCHPGLLTEGAPITQALTAIVTPAER